MSISTVTYRFETLKIKGAGALLNKAAFELVIDRKYNTWQVKGVFKEMWFCVLVKLQEWTGVELLDCKKLRKIPKLASMASER